LSGTQKCEKDFNKIFRYNEGMRYLTLILSILLISFSFVFAPTTKAEDIITNQKLITIDTGKQKLFAWDNGQIVFETPVSTGMMLAPTVRGGYKIQRKVPLKDMKGQVKPYKKYYIKDVPNIMYFYQSYAIHGTWWHNAFGRKASHGCVNVPVPASKWLYDWTPIGTRVEIF